MRVVPRKRILALLLAAFAAPASAQEEPAVDPRPRVGLVLSGGGARGAAHIGVLRVLEAHDIRIDAIAGTSMGSIIGGLYAAGLSPDEIEGAIAGVAWGEAFQDRPPRSMMSLRRKRDERDFMSSIELGIKHDGFAYSRGIFQGQNLGLLLRRFASTAELIEDFDELPIPYRAVATDAATGEAVVLDSGDLPTAMRASMSVPGVFEPVLLDGRLLVDGGLSAQTPVSVVRRMGVDVVIVVDLTLEEDVPPGALNTPFGLLANLMLLDVTRNARRDLDGLTPLDILIKPDLEGFTSADFGNAVAMIPAGEAAAERLAWRLDALSRPSAEFDEHLSQLRRRTVGAVYIDRIIIENDSKLSDDVIRGRLDVVEGSLIDFEELRRSIELVYGLGYFESVTYDLDRRGGETVLILRVARKQWGPVYARFGVQLYSDFRGSAGFNAGTRILVTEVNSFGAEWITDVQLGDYSVLRTAFYQPLDRKLTWFVEPHAEYTVETFDLYLQDGSRFAEYEFSELTGGVDLGYTVGNWGEVRTGAEVGDGRGSRQTGTPLLPSGTYGVGDVDLGFEIDTLDRWNFSSSGTYLSARYEQQFEGMGSSQDIGLFQASALHAHSFRQFTLHGWGVVGTADREPQVQNIQRVGGLFRLSGLAEGELLGRTAGMLGVGFRRRFGDLEDVLQRSTYLGLTLESGGAWFDNEPMTFDSMVLAGSLYVGMDTFAGPLYFAWGHADRGRDRFYFVLGRSINRFDGSLR